MNALYTLTLSPCSTRDVDASSINRTLHSSQVELRAGRSVPSEPPAEGSFAQSQRQALELFLGGCQEDELEARTSDQAQA